jgi:cytoskeletal protein CcmA (bactofilin family)
VGGDVLAAGGTIMLSEKASVEGDVLAAGGNVDISSSVAGSLKVKAGSVRINSKVSGSVSVEAGQSLVFGPQAEVTGKVFYKGPQEATVQSGAKVSNIEFTRVENRGAGRHFKALFTGALLIKLLAWIAAILLLVRFLPRRTKTIVDLAYAKPWSNLGIGFVGLVLFPVAVIVLFLTLIGYYIAVVLLVTYIMILLLAMLLAALFVGNLIIRWLTKKPDAAADWQSVLIGVGVFTLLSFIPFVGWLACAILVLMVMGSMLKMLRAELV